MSKIQSGKDEGKRGLCRECGLFGELTVLLSCWIQTVLRQAGEVSEIQATQGLISHGEGGSSWVIWRETLGGSAVSST